MSLSNNNIIFRNNIYFYNYSYQKLPKYNLNEKYEKNNLVNYKLFHFQKNWEHHLFFFSFHQSLYQNNTTYAQNMNYLHYNQNNNLDK